MGFLEDGKNKKQLWLLAIYVKLWYNITDQILEKTGGKFYDGRAAKGRKSEILAEHDGSG